MNHRLSNKLSQAMRLITLSGLVFIIACNDQGVSTNKDKLDMSKQPITKKIHPDESAKQKPGSNVYKNAKPIPMPTVDDPGVPVDIDSHKTNNNFDPPSSSPGQPPEGFDY